MKNLLLIQLIFSFGILAGEITRMHPRENSSMKPGEINFQWQREAGDKSPVTLEVRTKGRNIIVLERRTIGSRRTRYLPEGEYEWRIFNNSKIEDSDWHSFKIDSGTKKVSKRSPVVAVPKEEPVPAKKGLSYIDQMRAVKTHILKNSKKPKSVEILQWFEPEASEDDQVKIRVRFRGKNTFGELKEQDFLFTVKGESVEDVINLKAID
jgi:hypothetical protein